MDNNWTLPTSTATKQTFTDSLLSMIDVAAQTFLKPFLKWPLGGRNANTMHNKPRLVIDTMSEVYDILKPWADEEFWDFASVDLKPGSVYVIGRQHLMDHKNRVRHAVGTGQVLMIFGNSAEGSWTLETQIKQLKIDDLVQEKKLLLIGGSQMADQYPCLEHEHFLPRILDYDENITAQKSTEQIFDKKHKPYKFLFLNGRARPHRKYLYERFKRNGTLDQSLYTMLDARPCVWRNFQFRENGVDIMATPTEIRHLPPHYEVTQYRNPEFGPRTATSNIKQELFHREWGEIYLEPAPYIDTYFSVVTETICAESIHSFRTEKTAKPLAMGHPFIIASTPGFYRDLHRMGFQTFGHVIDETFDQIDNAQQRMDRIVDIVADLCRQDLASFLAECYNTCKYNQQHLAEFRLQERQEFPERFFKFVSQYQ